MFDTNPQSAPLDTAAVATALNETAATIAPVWPLKTFVAVNPYFGHAGREVATSMTRLTQTAGARSTMNRTYYAAALKTGDITDSDLSNALEILGARWSVDDVKESLRDETAAPLDVRSTVGSVAAQTLGIDWAEVAVDCLSQFASHYFDGGQATTRIADCKDTLWKAWRSYAEADRSLHILGLKSAHRLIAGLPKDRDAAASFALSELGLTERTTGLYLERLARTVGGWAAYARQSGWLAELDGAAITEAVKDLITARLVLDWVIYEVNSDALWQPWASELWKYEQSADTSAEITIDAVLQQSLEEAAQRKLIAEFACEKPAVLETRPDVQAAFCIDVRSEIIRRAFEAVIPRAETLGFAGFFGFAVDVQPLASEAVQSQCPVLLKPSHTVKETHTTDAGTQAQGRREMARFKRAFKRFKNSAVGSFAFVEMFGLIYGVKLISDALGLTAPAPFASRFGLKSRDEVLPDLNHDETDDTLVGFSAADRLDMAERVLRGMSLTGRFARRIILVGHGSTSRNNPHSAGLDCGACGGHSGEMNARLAARILNDDNVREGLKERGLDIPADTRFYGGVHDTTSDEIALFKDGTINAEEANWLTEFSADLKRVAILTRKERAPLMHIEREDAEAGAMTRRGEDWAQVRPEWGLAGCSSFIAAPRHRTNAHMLQGRAFLHSYDWTKDADFEILELIMTAPMVVASWINLQYYASTLDNDVFGSGNKTLHNVVGRVGVLEGNGGDLRVGLPLQSIHDGERYIHTPHRLNVVLEAPRDAMDQVINRHPHVRDLLNNGWIHLFSMDDKGRVSHKYDRDCCWIPLTNSTAPNVKEKAA